MPTAEPTMFAKAVAALKADPFDLEKNQLVMELLVNEPDDLQLVEMLRSFPPESVHAMFENDPDVARAIFVRFSGAALTWGRSRHVVQQNLATMISWVDACVPDRETLKAFHEVLDLAYTSARIDQATWEDYESRFDEGVRR